MMKFGLQIFKPKPPQIENPQCLNCGQPFTGIEKFCSYCGQKNRSKKLTFGIFINNIVSGFFSYDSRFWNTFIPLLTKPGQVSKQYIEGKRARFVNPFQLYLNVSIIFFLVLGISNRNNESMIPYDDVVAATQNLDSLKETKQHQIDSIVENVQNEVAKKSPNDSNSTKVITNIGDVFKLTQTESIDSLKNNKPYQYHSKTDTITKISFSNRIEDFQHYYTTNPESSSNQMLDSLGYPKTFWNTFSSEQVINSNKNLKQILEDGGKQYVNKIFSYLSISLFVFLPIFTFFLMLLYFRRKYTYMEHLVFVFNTQTVFFLLLLIFYLLDFMVDMKNTAWVFMVLFLIYLYKALRNFYKQSRTKTIVKYFIINTFYMFLALIGGVIIAAVSFVSS